MKRRILMAMAALALMGMASSSGAAPSGSVKGIKGSPHDLSFTTPGANQTDQVCVFCHTPHNAVQAVPLWNRNASTNTAGSFQLYTSSQTFDMKPNPSRNGFTSDSISLFCMSCHDGSALGGSMIGAEPAGVTNAALIPNFGASPTAATGIGAKSTNFSTDLTKSHPVNFVYDSTKDAGIVANATLLAGKKFPLFKALGVANNLECASCHAVHGQTNTTYNYPKFLRSTMAGSALCLGCHIK
ncbi:cytochrome c3 family protein [Geobacter grbiciae]|uniref:cytochrome c3 family protein n=1 Tax=Geobacter grbiciae TaxID=155042 RepID=UPI001C020631|nr:cytochrome c3 family protein [Geobacter grbiciae]MBT1075029.1 cytochrome C [Geobacter grbiciae]